MLSPSPCCCLAAPLVLVLQVATQLAPPPPHHLPPHPLSPSMVLLLPPGAAPLVGAPHPALHSVLSASVPPMLCVAHEAKPIAVDLMLIIAGNTPDYEEGGVTKVLHNSLIQQGA